MTRTPKATKFVAYFMAVVTDTNMAWTLVPRRATAPIMANTTPDATTQYSIEVAPDFVFEKGCQFETHRYNLFSPSPDQTKRLAGRLDG